MYNKFKISKHLLIIALIFGIWLVYISNIFPFFNEAWKLGTAVIVSLSFYILSDMSIVFLKKNISKFDQFLDNTSIEILSGGTAGLTAGIFVGILSGYPLSGIYGIGNYLAIGIFFITGYIGLKIGTRRAGDIFGMFLSGKNNKKKDFSKNTANYKVIDTSAIIDGRIYDVCLSNFLEGSLIVPTFVIEELQHIADSADNIRRNKGRRGLELLSKMQKNSNIKIDIIETNMYKEKEVDARLLCLCKELKASIITNDYNLNKVAELQGINVLNFNELANAVKVIVYPGETMRINIIKEGKEAGQGVGYLDDGTMVVVEDACNEIGHDLEVMVTSVFQTAAGKMIFTRKHRKENQSNIKEYIQNIQEVSFYG